jgi:Family of unknown function (DUF6370)
MRTLGKLVLGLGVIVALGLTALAADKDKDKDKEVTLKGTLTCGKCDLKKSDDCANVLKVTEKVDGKDTDVIYWLKDEGKTEKYHACTKPKMASVTGVVSEKDGKKWITPSKDGVKVQ